MKYRRRRKKQIYPREDIPDVAQCCRDVIILRRRPYHRRDVSDEKAP